MTQRNILMSLCTGQRQFIRSLSTKTKLTNAEVKRKRNELFGKEKARQASLITKIEKIQVEYKGLPESCTLLMNKNLSTPFNCAMHMEEILMNRSVLALVNGQPWDMHRPLVEDCELEYLHFKDEDPSLSNETFWRSMSFMLGYVAENAFKDQHYVQLCSFPEPDVKSGSFVYDVDTDLPDWSPSMPELNCLSRIGGKLSHEDIRFERLDVDASVAEKIFEDNRFKSQHISQISAQSGPGLNVTLYRLGTHVDLSRGPLMSGTHLLNRFNVTAVHDVETQNFGNLKRFQGMAVPKQLPIHYWAYDLLCERSKQLNNSDQPQRNQENVSDSVKGH